MGKNSFVLYDTDGDLLDFLTDEEAGKLFRAIFDFRRGAEPELTDKGPKTAFRIIRSHLEIDARKYAETCEKNRQSGKKGGEANAKRALASASDSKRNIADIDTDRDMDMERDTVCDKETDAEGKGEGVKGEPHRGTGPIAELNSLLNAKRQARQFYQGSS